MSTERWVTWVEPYGPNFEPVYMFVPESTAVACMKALLRKKYYKGEYKNKEEALADFLAGHWAYITEKPNGIEVR